MLKTKLAGIGSEVPVDETEGCIEPALQGIIVERLLQLRNLGAEPFYRLRKAAVTRYGFNIFQVVSDAARNTGLLCKILLLNSKPFIVLNARGEVPLDRPELLFDLCAPSFKRGKTILKARRV